MFRESESFIDVPTETSLSKWEKKNFMFVYHTHSFLFLSLLILMLSIATMTIIQICLALCITMERTWHRYPLYLTIYILKVSYYSEFHVHKNIPLRKTEGTPKKCAPLSRSERDVKADYMHSIVFHMFYCVYRCVCVYVVLFFVMFSQNSSRLTRNLHDPALRCKLVYYNHWTVVFYCTYWD